MKKLYNVKYITRNVEVTDYVIGYYDRKTRTMTEKEVTYPAYIPEDAVTETNRENGIRPVVLESSTVTKLFRIPVEAFTLCAEVVESSDNGESIDQ